MDVTISTWPILVIVPFVTLMVGGVCVLIHIAISRLSRTKWAGTAMSLVSPQVLAMVGVIFALLIGFLGNTVWNDNMQARRAVADEARALDQVILIAKGLPEDMRAAVRLWVNDYVRAVVNEEWSAMANGQSEEKPYAILYQVLEAVIASQPVTSGEQIAQTMVIEAINETLSVRNQRIQLSLAEIGSIKWGVMLFLAVLVLITVGVLHQSNPIAMAISLGLCGAAIVASLTLIVSYNRPFVGEHAVAPTPLLHLSVPGD